MKVGDMVKWRGAASIDQGIVVDGPRQGWNGAKPVDTYKVAWLTVSFDPVILEDGSGWHHDYYLEVLSESR
jgi:hypothetical protein